MSEDLRGPQRDRLAVKCTLCDREIDGCALCDRDECERKACYRCAMVPLLGSLGPIHSHGG